MTTITFAQAYFDTNSKTVKIRLSVQTDVVPQPGSYTLTLLHNNRQVVNEFEVTSANEVLEIDTYMIPEGSIQVPEVTKGIFSLTVGDSYPYVIDFTCWSVGFACEIESIHRQSVALTLT